MSSPTPTARAPTRLRLALLAVLVVLLGAPALVDAQVVEGVQKGAREGNKAAGPVGGVLGGAIGGVVGVVTGVTGVLTGGGPQQTAPAKDAKQGDAAKSGKAAKDAAKDTAKGAKVAAKQPAVLTQTGAPQITAEQIVANSDANI